MLTSARFGAQRPADEDPSDMPDAVSVDAVLFDMDGTLLNSWDALVGAYHDATRQVLGAPAPVEREDIDHLIQLRAREAFPMLAGGDIELAGRIEAAFAESYRSRADQIDLYDGVAEMLRDLRARDIVLGIATSKSRARLDRDLEMTGIGELMDATICGDEVPAAKPDPAPLRAAMDMLGVERAATLFVGDGSNDVLAAQRAGTRAVGAGYGFHPELCRAAGPDFWLEAPRDLPDLVAGLRSAG
jgi:HAD superfamily hydrolase (TIGR01509 family)